MAALLRTVITILLVAFSTAPLSAAEKRVALVIGNGDYQQLPRLLNSPAIAALIEKSLRNVGFKTFLVTNGTRQDMVRSLKSFTDAIDQDTAVLVFYAGHGIQFDQGELPHPRRQPVDERRRPAARGLQPEAHHRADQPRAAEDCRLRARRLPQQSPGEGEPFGNGRGRRPAVWRGPPGRSGASSPLPPPPAMWRRTEATATAPSPARLPMSSPRPAYDRSSRCSSGYVSGS